MGNQHSNPKTARVLDTRGQVQQVKLPMTAAELILEQGPGYVISGAEDLGRTGRIVPMRADDELCAGKLYVTVPASKSGAKISETEMAALQSMCKKNRRSSKRGGSKVLPAVAVQLAEEKDKFSGEDIDGHRSQGNNYHMNRRWKPVLEPIAEVC